MYTLIILIVSLIALFWSANHLINGARGLAAHFKISPFIVGLTLIALGTSAPELLLSIISSLKADDDFIIGNSIGSNIANIGLVLGITILVKPHALNHATLKKNISYINYQYAFCLQSYSRWCTWQN